MKITWQWLILTILTLLLVSCGGQAPAPSAQEEAAAPAATEAAAPAEEAAAPAKEEAAPGEKVKVTWWEQAPEDQYRELLKKEFVESFNAAHDDIEVEMIFQEDLDRVLRTAIQGGAAPDIIFTPGPSFVLEYVNAGFITPLDEYAQQYGWQEKMLEWAYDSGKVQGKLYSLPLTYETMVLYYNKALFEEKGWSPPTNRGEVEKLCEAADAEELICFSHSNQYWKGVNEWMVGVFYNNYAGADNVYAALQGKKPWTDPEFVEANQVIKEWVDKGWFSGSLENYFGLTHDDIWQALCDKKALMNIEGTWAFQDAPRFCGEDWDWAPLPALREDVTPSYVLAIGSTLSINAKSPNPDAAAAVLDWVVNDKARAARIIEGFNFGEWNVPLRFTASDFSSSADPRYIRFVEEFAKDTGEGRFGYTTWTFWPAKTDQYIIEELDGVLTGDMTVEDYQAEQQRLFTEEFNKGLVPPAPPTKIQTKS